MKRLILCYILSSLMFGLHAQQEDNYRPLVEEGKRWTYDNYLALRPEKYNHFYVYYLQGDTVIGGKNCLRMYAENEGNDGKIAHYIGALYEESKKVYMIEPEREAYILYDFDCKEGDVITAGGETLKVVRISTQQNEERNLRVYELLPTAYEEGNELPVTWIEGVGCTKDFFGMIPFNGNYNSLVCCEVNGETLYQYVQPKYTEEGYHEMAIEGKTWNYIHHFVDEKGEHDEPYCYIVKGDTLLQERFTYKKLYRQDASGERYVGTILEEGRDVYMLPAGATVWRSLYQFGRDDIGRVFDWESKYGRGRVYWMLNTIDTIQVRGQDFRRLIALQRTIKGGTPKQLSTIEDGEDVWHDIWIEGVGSQYSGIEAPIPEAQPDNDYSYLESCYENGECIFTAADFTTGIRNISTDAYRPFVEDGKVWKVGWFLTSLNPDIVDPHEAYKTATYYFVGDTIIGGHQCKKMMCNLEYKDQKTPVTWWGGISQTYYQGALYEKDKHVFFAYPNEESFVLLYDFASDEGCEIEIYHTDERTLSKCRIGTKTQSTSNKFHGIITKIIRPDINTPYNNYWMEGVGYKCIHNLSPTQVPDPDSPESCLMSCSVGDEVLYDDSSLSDGVHHEEDNSEVKKQWLDFTHTVKTKPKGPRKDGSPSAGSETGVTEGNGTDEAQALTGEYSAKELFVSLQPLAGPYTVSISNAAGEVVYEKEVQTSNVVALNTDLTKYADGTYTLLVENADEAYTATLTIGEGTAIRNLSESPNNGLAPSSKFNVPSSMLFDLSGRRLSAPPARGVYINSGKVRIVKSY